MLTYSIAWFHRFYRKFPLGVQHLGAGGSRGRAIGPVILPAFTILETSAFKGVDLFLVQSLMRKREITAMGVSPHRVKIRRIGVDFDLFRPQDQNESRRILGLPLGKILALYVGRFNKDKGLDVIIETIDRLKNSYDIDLIAVGGFETDPLWPSVRRNLRYYATRIPSQEIVRYY